MWEVLIGAIGGAVVTVLGTYLVTEFSNKGRLKSEDKKYIWDEQEKCLIRLVENVVYFHNLEAQYIPKITGLDIGDTLQNRDLKVAVRLATHQKPTQPVLSAATAKQLLHDYKSYKSA